MQKRVAMSNWASILHTTLGGWVRFFFNLWMLACKFPVLTVATFALSLSLSYSLTQKKEASAAKIGWRKSRQKKKSILKKQLLCFRGGGERDEEKRRRWREKSNRERKRRRDPKCWCRFLLLLWNNKSLTEGALEAVSRQKGRKRRRRRRSRRRGH